jgi:hypothetical protein
MYNLYRNEAPYLQEWIEYHRMIGFDSFLIMNDNSTDDTQCLLDAYSKAGIVQRIPEDIDDNVYGRPQVKETLNYINDRVFDVCSNYLASRPDASRTWMMTHDTDEFLAINKTDTVQSLQDAVRELSETRDPRVQSISVPRLEFGSSGLQHYDDGLMIERFHRRYDKQGCRNVKQQPLSRLSLARRRREKNKKKPAVRKKDNPRSYCEYDGGAKTFQKGKSLSLVSSLAQTCFEPVDGQTLPATCHGPHRHTLRDQLFVEGNAGQRSFQVGSTHTLNENDKRYLRFAAVGNTLTLLHYAIKSREEFYQRVCGSVWREKYFRCPGCTPESYFDITETYANNYEDNRMAPFVAELKSRLQESTVGASCKTQPIRHSREYYEACFEQGKHDRHPALEG